MLINGRCHCGNISFALDWQPEPTEIPARACTCSFCTKHGGVWTSCPTGSLKVAVKEPSRASSYAFGTKTAQIKIEELNLFNRPNVRTLSGRNNFSNTNFGQTGAQAGFMRITQIMFRYSF